MADDIQKQTGVLKSYTDDRGKAALYPHAIIGIVKNNVDPTHSGKISVFLKRLNSRDADNPSNWNTVSYLSPFFGYTPNTGSPDGNGDYVNNPNSYGFWAPAPDLNTEVVCVFINGDPNFGFYIGSIPRPGLNHMVPAIGSSDSIIPNAGEASSYGGATKLPVSEINNANAKQDNDSQLAFQPRPVHSYQAAILNKQGLIRDPDRGTIGSTSVRESPSRVFGWSTPGRPIYQGGYTNDSIKDAIKKDDPDKNFKVIGRLGGHSFVMDDGDIIGQDQLVRLRTATGHMILMNDSAQTLFIIHANGQSYIELGKEGTIDMFSSNSVNIRTKGDLNLHADNNININAAKDLNIHGNNINIESLNDTKQLVGATFAEYVKGNYTTKIDSKYSINAKDDIGIKSSGTTYIEGGPNVKMNTGSSSLVPDKVAQITVNAHSDTLYDSKTGYSPAPGALSSIVSRAPAHTPWSSANQGVDVKNNDDASANFPAAPSAGAQAANSAASSIPKDITSASLASTVPNVGEIAGQIDAVTSGSLISQMAVNAASGPLGDIVSKGAGVVSNGGDITAAIGPLGLTPSQLVTSGHLKPGADTIISKINPTPGIGLKVPTNLFTGKDGITDLAGMTGLTGQTNAAKDLLGTGLKGLTGSGLLSGNESASQIGGLALSAATGGLGPTLAFASGAGGLSAGLGAATALAGGLGLKLPDNPLGGDPASLIAGGNFAAGLAGKVLNPLGGINVADDLKGAASGVFDKIKAKFKAFKPGEPVSLTVAKAEAEASSDNPLDKATDALSSAKSLAGSVGSLASAAGSLAQTATGALGNIDVTSLATTAIAASTGIPPQLLSAGLSLASGGNSASAAASALTGTTGLPTSLSASSLGATGAQALLSSNPLVASSASTFGALSGVSLGGVGSIPGGASAISNIISGNPLASASIPGVSALTGLASGAAGLDSVKGLLGNAKSLASLTSTGLNAADAASLSASIASMGMPGAVKVALPTTLVDANNVDSIKKQSASLLGDSKIPPLSFSSTKAEPLSSSDITAYNDIKKQADDAEVKYFELRKALADAALTYGPFSPQALSAKSALKDGQKQKEDLNTQLAALASKGLSTS